jgi:uncharacterized protein
MKSEKIILDTSIFVNPEAKNVFGRKPTSAFCNFLKLAETAEGIEFYMPPSIFEELMNFIDKRKISAKLLIQIHKKPPKKYELKTPAFFLYELVEDMRNRINKGLRIAEKGARDSLGKKKADDVIKKLRHDYRVALRVGTLDSKEDIDLILLAKELQGSLVSIDNGVIKWAHKLGIKCIEAKDLKNILRKRRLKK